MRKINAIVICILLLFCCTFSAAASSILVDPSETWIVSEELTPIENHALDNLGWIGIDVTVPSEFAGTIRVQLVSDAGSYLIEVNALAYGFYYGGEYLPSGLYTVKSLSMPGTTHFQITADLEQVTISPDTEAHLQLEVTEAEDVEEEIQQIEETYTAPTTSTISVTNPQPSETIAVTQVTTPSNGWIASAAKGVLAAALFAAGIFALCSYIKRKRDESVE